MLTESYDKIEEQELSGDIGLMDVPLEIKTHLLKPEEIKRVGNRLIEDSNI
jgi:hypothetical protein